MLKSLKTLAIAGTIFAMTNSLLAVDVAPRITDKEIVQSLADIKSEFKVIHAKFDAVNEKIDGVKNELNAKFDAVYAQMEGNKKELQAQMEGNKNELNAKFDAKIDGIDAKFDLMINILWGVLAAACTVIIALIVNHLKVTAPLVEKCKDMSDKFKSIELPSKQVKSLIEALKELAARDVELKKVLTKFNLL